MGTMHYRINGHQTQTMLLGNRSALEAYEILAHIDSRLAMTIPEACTKAGITWRTYGKWDMERPLIRSLARNEWQGQFVRLSAGISGIRRGSRHRFQEILKLSLGLNEEQESFSLEEIAERHGVSHFMLKIRARDAELELLEFMGILHPTDPVAVLRHTIRGQYRRGHHQRSPARRVQASDYAIAENHIRTLRRSHDLKKAMHTVERRWGLHGQPQRTLQQIADEEGITINEVLLREQTGHMALHQHVLLTDQTIPEDVRVWSGLVFLLLNMKSSEQRRSLARTLDTEQPWNIPGILNKLQTNHRELLLTRAGMENGYPYPLVDIANGKTRLPKTSAKTLKSREETAVECLREAAGVPRHTVECLNTLSRAMTGRCPRSAVDVLDDEQIAVLESRLSVLESDASRKPGIRALRLRLGLADGSMHTIEDIESTTGIPFKAFRSNAHRILREVEKIWHAEP